MGWCGWLSLSTAPFPSHWVKVPSEPWVLLRDLYLHFHMALSTYCPIPSVLRLVTASPCFWYCHHHRHDYWLALPSSYCVPDIRLKNHWMIYIYFFCHLILINCPVLQIGNLGRKKVRQCLFAPDHTVSKQWSHFLFYSQSSLMSSPVFCLNYMLLTQ